MGRFRSAFLVLLAACSDNLGSDGLAPVSVDELDTDGIATATPRYVPAVCAAQSWQTTVNASTVRDVSVSAWSGGAIALAAPRAGGELTGLVLDTHMEMLSEKSVAIDDEASHVTASYIRDRVASATANGGAVIVHLLDADLADPRLVTKIAGNALAEPTFVGIAGTENELVMPVGADDGVWLHRFDGSFKLQGSMQLLATGPVHSITAAHIAGSLLTAWSTDNDCYLALSNAYGQGINTHVPTACPDPRIAFDAHGGRGVVVFDSRDSVGIMHIQLSQFGGDTRILRDSAMAPRVVFDGKNFWVSYLDLRSGNLVVGFLDGSGAPVAMRLDGLQPDVRGYELVLVDGDPWVFALTSDGYDAYQLCIEAQW